MKMDNTLERSLHDVPERTTVIRVFQVAIVVVPEGEALREFGHEVFGNEGMDIAAISVFALCSAAVVLVLGLLFLAHFGELLPHYTRNEFCLNTRNVPVIGNG